MKWKLVFSVHTKKPVQQTGLREDLKHSRQILSACQWRRQLVENPFVTVGNRRSTGETRYMKDLWIDTNRQYATTCTPFSWRCCLGVAGKYSQVRKTFLVF